MMTAGTVIIGASHAGIQVAVSLREDGYQGRILVIDRETTPPHQKPALSKGFLKGEVGESSLAFRSDKYYQDNNIEILLGYSMTSIDRINKSICLLSIKDRRSHDCHYENLVLCVGASARKPPFSTDSPKILTLRNLSDAKNLKAKIDDAMKIAIIGSGFIGLECASTATVMGKKVTIIERNTRVLSNLTSKILSTYIQKKHESAGVKFIFGESIKSISEKASGEILIKLNDNRLIEANLLIVGIGASLNTEVAKKSGISVDNGVLVSKFGQTSDSHIFSCGDCTTVVYDDGSRSHVESVQNAVDQAKNVSALITGKVPKEPVTPWFWSDQTGFKLQIVGNTLDYDDCLIRGSKENDKFSLLYYRKENLVRVDSVNSPGDHLAARKLIDRNPCIPKSLASNPEIRLKSLIEQDI
tara:strand:- start:2100 stop:3341 length:1242 start_codon:yes stop_codon:yes gene_type:complete